MYPPERILLCLIIRKSSNKPAEAAGTRGGNMKIDLITGLLGAGKTTLIRLYAEYLIAKGEKICILENDYGAVNVDMMFLQDMEKYIRQDSRRAGKETMGGKGKE